MRLLAAIAFSEGFLLLNSQMGVAAMLCIPPCKQDGKKVVSYLHVGGQMEQA